jgi:hypothetical protein
MTTELHRPVVAERIGRDGQRIEVTARPEELASLAARLGVPAVLSLRCVFDLRALPGGVVAARGVLEARLTQVCVISLDEFDSDVKEGFSLRFVPAGTESAEIDLEGEDELAYSGGVLDLGEAAAEQLALALDPYPRHPDAELTESDQVAEDGPFGRLTALRRGH